MKAIRYIKPAVLSLAIMLSTQACVGKFLSTLLSTENAQFKLLEVVPVANTKILVGFNKPLDYTQGALALSNYSIPGLNPISVSKGPETNQVYLFLDPNAPDNERMQRQFYTLRVSGIKNLYLDDLLPGDENRSRQFMGARWLRATCLDDAGTFTCPSSGTTLAAPVTVTVRGDYARGSEYRWRLHNVTDGTDLFALSVWTPVAMTFTIPAGIASKDYRLDLLIRDDAGAEQPANDTTQYFFSVDNTSVSDIGLSNVPAALTSSTVTNISVAYRNCVEAGFPNGYAAPCYSAATPVSAQIPASYKYRVGAKTGAVTADCNDENSAYTFGAWSATRSTNLPINEILSTNQCYTIQVVAADNVGNFQCNTAVADTTAGACANPAGPGDGSISDFFDNDTNGDSSVVGNKAFQQVRFLLDTTAPNAAFVTNTLPVATTSATSFAIAVDSTGISKYQYRVIGTGFSGTWSTDKDPGTTGGDLISAAGLINGTYRIEIVGKDAAGNYQATGSATGYDFVVDTTAPTATLASQGTCTGDAGTTSAPDNGLPRNPTRYNCHNIRVNNVTFYRYYIGSGVTCPTDAGLYSAQRTSASDFIAADSTAWVNGSDYSICVIGSNNGALYQGTSASAVTRHTFRYDTTPPTSQVVTWISPALNLAGLSTVNTDVNVQIGKAAAENLVGYKGTIVTGACPTSATMVGDNATYPERSPETPLQATGLAVGTVRICFIGRDAAGNYEATTQSVTYTVFAPPAPNDGDAVLDNLFSNTFNFTWVTGAGIPTGTQEIRIRVCKDAACTEPLPGMQNGVVVCNTVGTCNATSSYTLNSACAGLGCIKQLNGSSYYAQLKVKDSVGVESSFSASSSGKRIVGAITGTVRDTNNNPISGATVQLFYSATGNTDGPICGTLATQIGASATSAGDGTFTFNLAGTYAIPIRLATNGYCVKVSTTGPVREGTKTYIEANAGATTNAGSIYAVSTTGKGCMIGAVVDGSNGSQLLLSNATFTLKDFQNATLASTPNLDPDGKQFAFPASCVTSWGAAPYNSPTFDHAGAGLNAGVYSLQIAIPSYYTISETGIAIQDVTTTNLGYLPMVGTFANGSKQIKVILTWGNQTKDLDMHVVGPSSGIDCQPYNEAAIQNSAASKFHISFQQRYCAETGTTAPTGSTSLAVDDSFEYGPEIINFYDGYVNGTYKFSVFNNDVTALDWNVSKARIDIYAGNFYGGSGGLVRTIISTGSSALRGWRPFRMTVAGVTNSFPPGGTLTIDDTTGVGYANYTYGVQTVSQVGPRNGTRTNGSVNVTGLATTADLIVGMGVTGTGMPAGGKIATIVNGTSITLTANATSGGTNAITFTNVGVFTCNGTHINGPSDGRTAGGAPPAGANPADPNLDCGLFSNGTTVLSGAGPLDW